MHDGEQWSLATSRRLRFATCVVLALLGTTPATATAPGRLRAPSPVGTVDTVAGPGFCSGPANPDATSGAVGGLAADGTGSLWFETGDVSEGRVTKVFNTTSVVVERTGGVPAGKPGSDGARPRAASAGRMAGDGSGGLLIAKSTAVLRLGDGLTTVAGTTSTVIGGAAPEGGLGDGGPLAAARFNHIAAIAADGAGNVYVADEIDREEETIAVRFLNRSDQPVTFYPGTAGQLTVAPGTVGTIAGGSGRGDRQTATARLVARAPALAVAEGRLYLGATRPGPRPRGEVRLVNLGGGELSAHGVTLRSGEMALVATLEGAVRAPAHLAGLPPVAPLPGIAVDGGGNLLLADPAGNRVRRLDASGALTTFAGTGAAGFNGNDRAAVSARLDRPYDVEVGPGGRVYISDAGNGQVRFVDEGGIVHAALGNGAGMRWDCRGSGGPNATSAGPKATGLIGAPVSLAADGLANAYLATPGLGQVHRLAPSGQLQPIVGRPAGSPCGSSPGCAAPEGAQATTTDLAQLAAVGLGSGGLYVQDGTRVRFVNLGRRPLRVHGVVVAPGAVRTVAGRATPDNAIHGGAGTGAPLGPDGDGGPALEADISVHRSRLGFTGALVADRRGNLFIADHRGRVRQVDARGIITTPLTSPPRGESGRIDPSRCCSGPTGLALDQAGNLYIADRASSRVWFYNRGSAAVVVHGVSVAPGAVEAVAGSTTAGSKDEGGRAIEASLAGPWGVAVDRSGNLYVVDVEENTVRRVDAAGTITTVVGTGQRGFNGDGLKGALTALDRPIHAVIDSCGNLLIAEFGNDRVRRLNLVASCPAARPSATPAARRPRGALVAATAAILATVVLAVGRARRRWGAGDDGDGRARRS